MKNKKLLERQFLIEEYRALRSEIQNKMEQQYKIVSLGVGGISLLLGFAIKEGYFPLFFVLPFLIVAAVLLQRAEISSILNAGEYIRTIESIVFKHNKRLIGWESWLCEDEERRRAYKIFQIGPLLIFSILYVTCVFFAIWHYRYNFYLTILALFYILIPLIFFMVVFKRGTLIGRRTKKSDV